MSDEELEICCRGVQAVVAHYGLLVAKTMQERVVSAATATFITINGQQLIVTADHVVSDLPTCAKMRLQVISGEALRDPETRRSPLEFEILQADRIPISDTVRLDLAVFRAPGPLCVARHIGWFNADLQVEAVSEVRREVSCHPPQSLATMLLGFPNFSRFSNDEAKLQEFISYPLWAYIERFQEPPAITGLSPQITLKVDPPNVEAPPGKIGRAFRDSIQQYWTLAEAEAKFDEARPTVGGYSGGPLMYFCESGNYLIGVITEGGVQLGGHAYAVPIDAVVSAIRTMPNWSRRT